MPKYTYKCTNCQEIVTRYHSFSERLADCSECGSENTLTRVPSNFLTEKQDDSPLKAGTLVKEYISETREELKKQKENLRRDWNDE